MAVTRQLQGTAEETEADYLAKLAQVNRPDWSSLSLGKTCCDYAALRGWLTVVQWLRQRGSPWGERTCTLAAYGGHLAVLQWVHQNGAPWTTQTTSFAMSGRHLTVYQWARQHGCPCDEDNQDWGKETVAAMTESYLVLRAAAPSGVPPELLKHMVIMAHGVT